MPCVCVHNPRNVYNKCNTSPQLSDPPIFKNTVSKLPILLDFLQLF